jgi:hypothetical protein
LEERKEAPKPDAAPLKLQPSPAAPAVKSPSPQAVMTFSPNLQITVNGDVKEPRKLAAELMPHLKRMFDDFAQKTARGDMWDEAHA